jgi:hypothetical protein
MRCLLGICSILIVTASLDAAPIPKSLKKSKNYNFDGVWEQTGSNVNGQEGGLSHGKYWKLEKDTFWYMMPDVNTLSNKSQIMTPDESQPQYKLYSKSRCLLELEDEDTLKWIFANEPNDLLEKCEPGPGRSLYTFKRVK